MQPVAVPQVLSLTEDLQAAVLKNLGPGCLSDARLVCSHLRGLVDQQLVTGLQVQVPGREVCVWYWGGQGSGVCWPGFRCVWYCYCYCYSSSGRCSSRGGQGEQGGCTTVIY